MWFLSIPLAAGVALCALSAATLSLGVYALVRRLTGHRYNETQQDSFAWGGLRIGSIHALIVSLTFASQAGEISELQETIDREALALEQLYRGLDAAYGPEAEVLQALLTEYTRVVIDEEWPKLAEGQVSFQADLLLDQIRLGLIALRQDESVVIFPAALLDDVNDVENARGQRSFDLHEPIPTLFWVIAVASFIGTVASAFGYPPGRGTTLAIGGFAALNGMIVYALLSFSHPFQSAAGVAPTALEAVYARTMARG